MGVKNINRLIKKYAPEAIENLSYSDCAGQVWAVDASIFIYRFCHNPLGKKDSPHLDGFYQLCYRLLLHQIQPVIVLDGPHKPSQKEDTLAERHQRRERIKLQIEQTDDPQEKSKLERQIVTFQAGLEEEIIHLCRLFHVPILTAWGEADSLCVQLYRNGLVDAIMSEDTDILFYGGGRMVRKFNWSYQIEVVTLDKILEATGLSYSQWVDLCLLCGTDYNKKTITGLGPEGAYRLIKNGCTLSGIIQSITQGESGFTRYSLPSESVDYQSIYQLLSETVSVPESICPSDRKSIDWDTLLQLMTSRCHYRRETVERHRNQLKPKLKLRLKIKS